MLGQVSKLRVHSALCGLCSASWEECCLGQHLCSLWCCHSSEPEITPGTAYRGVKDLRRGVLFLSLFAQLIDFHVQLL